MKKVKKLLSLLLTFVMTLTVLCGMFAGTKIEASAATTAKVTQNDAVVWLKNQDGAKYDFDGKYGTQCVEFVKAYVNYLVNGDPWSDCWNRPTLNGNNIWQNSIWKELGWTVYTNTADFMPQPGDIFSAGTSNGNHTGVVISSDLNKAVIADANARNSDWSDGDPVYVHTINWKSASSDTAYGATHYIRPNFKSAQNGWVKIGNDWYYYDANGPVTGWIETNGLWYYLDPDNSGKMVVGWKYIANTWYFFNDYGAMVTGWQKIASVWYYFNSRGAMVTGWQEIDGQKYYFNYSNGHMVTGWQMIDGKCCYFASWGAYDPSKKHDLSIKEYYKEPTCTENGNIEYYQCSVCGRFFSDLSGDNEIIQDEWVLESGHDFSVKEINSDTLRSEATVSNSATFWYVCSRCGTISNDKYFQHGDPIKIGWIKEGANYYYNDYTGKRVTGWKYIDNNWYYLNPTSGIMQTGWLQLGGKWYYLNSNGAMVTGWGSIGGKWYYFNSSGAMQTGWFQLGGKWYYLNSSGAMVTGWSSIGGKWYYFNNSGVMLTGWQQVGGKWYYFNSSGAMATGWIKLSGKWYYLNSSGAMVTGTQRISGKTYRFNSSGVWIA